MRETKKERKKDILTSSKAKLAHETIGVRERGRSGRPNMIYALMPCPWGGLNLGSHDFMPLMSQWKPPS